MPEKTTFIVGFSVGLGFVKRIVRFTMFYHIVLFQVVVKRLAQAPTPTSTNKATELQKQSFVGRTRETCPKHPQKSLLLHALTKSPIPREKNSMKLHNISKPSGTNGVATAKVERTRRPSKRHCKSKKLCNSLPVNWSTWRYESNRSPGETG